MRYKVNGILEASIIEKAQLLKKAGFIEEYEEIADDKTGEQFLYLYTLPPFPYSYKALEKLFERIFGGDVEDIIEASDGITQVIVKVGGDSGDFLGREVQTKDT